MASDTLPDLAPLDTIIDRRVLIHYACDLNLDPNTANYKLTLSEGNKKATYGASQSYPDHIERFDKWPQVLCKEALSGRHYWEVEWSHVSGEAIYVCVVYSGIQRKGEIADSEMGGNSKSWCFGKNMTSSQPLRAWYNVKVWEGPFPVGFTKVGVYLDWPAGTLSFYNVSSNTLSHIYTFRTKFTDPVLPGFWVRYDTSYIRLCPFE